MKESWNGKLKAITFSFDDGVTQDIDLIEQLNKYNLMQMNSICKNIFE